ncbi:MAG: DUF951 domain-containing protein [Ruminococcus sp.]|nr:DUF951 domain-containing protein [Ruminococcus sp.]MBQ9516341.1 DUF951 domain-containing protein [Ruminococcus sp.]
MDIRVNDELTLKKPHPCGCDRFLVLRVGMDFKIRCQSCSHEMMLPRKKVEKSIKSVSRDGEKVGVRSGE